RGESYRLKTLKAKFVFQPAAAAMLIHSIASGSSNRAVDNGPTSSVSKPSSSASFLTVAFASASSPQINIVAFCAPYFGLAMFGQPVVLQALTTRPPVAHPA